MKLYKIFLISIFVLSFIFLGNTNVFAVEVTPMFRIFATPVVNGSSTVTVKLYKSFLTCLNDVNCTVVQDICANDNNDPTTWPYTDPEQCVHCVVQERPELTVPASFPNFANRKLVWDNRGENGDMSYTINNITGPVTDHIKCRPYKSSTDPIHMMTHSITITPPPTVEIYEVGTGAHSKTISQGQLPAIQLNIDGTQIPDASVCTVTEPNNPNSPWHIPQSSLPYAFPPYTPTNQLPVNVYGYNVDCPTAGGTDNDNFALTVTSAINLTASQPTQNNPFSTTISNTGNIPSGTTPFNVLFQTASYFDDSGVPQGVKDFLAPNTVTNLVGPGTTSISSGNLALVAGTDRFIRACADKSSAGSAGVISETNENDNCSSWRSLTTLPDLTMFNSSYYYNNNNGKYNLKASMNLLYASPSTGFYVVFQKSDIDPNTNPPITFFHYKKSNFFSSLFYKIAQATGGISYIVYPTPSQTFSNTAQNITSPAKLTNLNYNNFYPVQLTEGTATDLFGQSSGIFWFRACADKGITSATSNLIAESNETNNCSDWKKIVIGGSVNGTCSSPQVYYNCASGTSANHVAGSMGWEWDCQGENGGTTEHCSQSMSGSLTASPTSCKIQRTRSSCNTSLSWSVVNPTGSISAVTTNYPSANTPIGTPGHSGTVTTTVKYDSQDFFLYNSDTTAPVLLETITVNSDCDTGLSWNGSTCDCPSGTTWNSNTNTCETISMPDLTAGVVSPSVVPINESVHYISVIKNLGNQTTGDGFWNVFQITDGAGSFQYLSPAKKISSALAPGESLSVSVEHTFTTNTGHTYMRACADKQNGTDPGLISESNENNNCSAWKEISIVGYPINGVCGANIYGCDAGMSTNNKDTGTKWTWKCAGINNGTPASCESATCPNGAQTATKCDDGVFCSNGATNPTACDLCSDGSVPDPITGCPNAHCFNGVKDADETGIDCGGTNCVACKKIPKYIER